MIPERRVPVEVLQKRARFEKRLQATTWIFALAILLAALAAPLFPSVPLAAAWSTMAALAVAMLVVQVTSLRRLRTHEEQANPPDPLAGRTPREIDFDKTWRDT